MPRFQLWNKIRLLVYCMFQDNIIKMFTKVKILRSVIMVHSKVKNQTKQVQAHYSITIRVNSFFCFYPISCYWSLSTPYENIRKKKFFDVFKSYRKRLVAWNGLIVLEFLTNRPDKFVFTFYSIFQLLGRFHLQVM